MNRRHTTHMEGVNYDLPTTKWDGEGKAGPTKIKGKHSKRNAKPYARTVCLIASFHQQKHINSLQLKQQPKKRESLINSSIGFIGGIFSRLLGVGGSSKHQDSESENEDIPSSPVRVCCSLTLILCVLHLS